MEDSDDEPKDEEESPRRELEQDVPEQAEAASLLLNMAKAGEQSAEMLRLLIDDVALRPSK